MKTAEQLYKEIKENVDLISYTDLAITAMKEYAREAIKEDRKNILKYIDIECTYGFGGTSCDIKNDSVINAPQIELL